MSTLSVYDLIKSGLNATAPTRRFLDAKPVSIVAEQYNGGLGQEGVAPGRESHEWHGLPVWSPDQWLVTDEHGQRQVLTTAELERYYQ